ncbi:MFS transporter [Streptomyces sp. NPDC053048]|uniref:MFS transporter n=1 Tax=Streptomyces sp. NPDC053048 TaxID=3365694 RepID=UPI0037D5A7E0
MATKNGTGTGTAQESTAGIWATFRESPLAVKTILAGVLMSRLGGFLNIFIVLYLTSKGYSDQQAAYALGVYGVGGVAGVFLGSTLADRLGARNATVYSMAGTAVLTASLLYLPNYGLLLAAVALVSMAAQLYRPASATLLSELTPDKRQVMIFAMYRFCLNLGTTIAPLVGFALYNANGESYTLLFWGEGLIALAYAVLARLTIPAAGRRADADDEGTDEGAAEGGRGGYGVLLRDRRYLLYLAATLFNAIVYVQYLSTLPLDVKDAGVPVLWYTVAVSANGFIVIAFELGLTKISQEWPIKLTVGLAFVLVGLGVAAYGLPLGPAVIIGATLLWTLGEIVGGPSVFAYPALAGPAHLRSRYIGSFQFVFALGMAIGPVVGGTLFVRIGHNVWPVFGALGLLAGVLGVAAVRTPAKEQGEEQESAREPVKEAAKEA